MGTPGFTAQRCTEGVYGDWSHHFMIADNSNRVTPQIGGTVYHMCCPSGDCDSTFCPNNNGAHVTCTNGKANTSCNNPLPSCFLSTACVSALSLPDDCDELATLRWFRDTHLMTRAEGRDLVSEYYRIAPTLCKLISQRQDAEDIYRRLFSDLVQKTVWLIKEAHYELACAHYRHMTYALRRELVCQSA